MKISDKILGASVIAGCLAMSSCVNSMYDLDYFDKVIHVGNESLVMPLSSVDQILLKNLIDTTDVFIIEDGVYRIRQKVDMDVEPIKIEDIIVEAPEIPDNETDIDRGDVIILNAKGKRQPGKNFDWMYSIGYNAVDLKVNVSKVTSDVMMIDDVRTIPSELTMTIDIANLSDHLKQLHASSFAISIPKGLDVSQVKLNGQDVIVTEEQRIALDRDALITFPEDMLIKPVGNTLSVTINGSRISTDDKSDNAFVFNPDDNTLFIRGKISVDGTLGFSKEDMIDPSMAIDALPSTTKMTVASVMSDTQVASFSGVLQHKVEIPGIDPIRLNSIPDFLRDDDVVLDLKNPKLILDLGENDLPANMTMSILVTSYDKNDDKLRTLLVGGMVIGKDNRTIHISSDPFDSNDFSGVITGCTVSELLSDVPDHLTVEILESDVLPQQVDGFDVTKAYRLDDANYIFESDLALGEDFRIVYRDTINGWHKDIKDFATRKITMRGNVHNTLPVDVSLTITPIDYNGVPLANFSVNRVAITARDRTSIEVEAVLEGDTADQIMDAFNSLDGIIIKAVGNVNQSVDMPVLRPEDYISIDDVRFEISGGLYINANKD